MLPFPTTLIAELHRDPRFKATCPVCMQDFRLSDAVLFALGEQPPKAALDALHAMRERILQLAAHAGNSLWRPAARPPSHAHTLCEKTIRPYAGYTRCMPTAQDSIMLPICNATSELRQMSYRPIRYALFRYNIYYLDFEGRSTGADV